MQKLVILKIQGDGNEKVVYNEPKEVSDLLNDGYKVVSVTPSNSGQGYYVVFVIILEKLSKKSISRAN